MRLRRILIFAAALTVTAASPATSHAQDTHRLHIYRGITPQRWLADVRAVLAPAGPALGLRYLARFPGQQLGIVLDIDNTAIATSFSDPGTIVAVPQVLRMAQQAAQAGVGVYFITGRTPGELDISVRQLTSAGYPVTGIYGRDVKIGLQASKTASRQRITESGVRIVASAGNNWTDLNGGFTEQVYKLPDYGFLG